MKPKAYTVIRYLLLVLFATGILPSPISLMGQQPIGKINMKKYDGIDVSRYQGNIDWKKVAKDKKIQFVYIKATEGTTITDPRYATNIKQARRQGLKCGSYHYLTSSSSIRLQFKKFKSVAKKNQQDLIPMVDVEREAMRRWTKRQVRDSLTLFCRLVKRHYGKSPIIYSHFKYYNSHLAPHFNRHYLYLGKYSWPQPRINGMGKHNIWQYSERGKIKGIKGYVDLNRFMLGTKLKDIKL